MDTAALNSAKNKIIRAAALAETLANAAQAIQIREEEVGRRLDGVDGLIELAEIIDETCLDALREIDVATSPAATRSSRPATVGQA